MKISFIHCYFFCSSVAECPDSCKHGSCAKPNVCSCNSGWEHMYIKLNEQPIVQHSLPESLIRETYERVEDN